MNYNFNTGLTSIHNIASIAKAVSASQNQYYDAKRLIIEQVRNAYISYNLSKLTRVLLRKQADISASFLELARKERKLGKRSLIDVLSGETALINARSDAEAAQNALVVSTFNVISIMGILTPDLIKLKGH
jgi:adhesin transport system outer membrane protein